MYAIGVDIDDATMEARDQMTADARRLVVPVAIVAAVLLFLLINPWLKIEPGSTLSTIVTVAFWILAIAVIVLMYIDSRDPEAPQVEIESPRFARFLFGNTRAGLFWLPIRLFVGFAWLEAGWHKLHRRRLDRRRRRGPGSATGRTRSRSPSSGRPPITYEWYRDFIQLAARQQRPDLVRLADHVRRDGGRASACWSAR